MVRLSQPRFTVEGMTAKKSTGAHAQSDKSTDQSRPVDDTGDDNLLPGQVAQPEVPTAAVENIPGQSTIDTDTTPTAQRPAADQ